MQPYGMTGRIARASGRHPWRVVGAWAVAFVLAFVVIAGFPSELTTDFEITNNPESERAEWLLEERMTFHGEPGPDELVVVASDTVTVDDAAFRAEVDSLVAALGTLDGSVRQAGNPYELDNPALFADDRSAAIIPVFLSDGDTHAYLDLLDEHDGEQGFTVVTGGQESIDVAFTETSESDLRTGETIGISVALLVLVVVFGTFVAAGVPLVLAMISIAIAFGITMLAGHVFDLSIYVVNMLIMIGLAVGIDYALFVVGRYREEREKGADVLGAITRTGDTAAKAVLFSGLTVVTALIGMLIVPASLFKSLGLGAIFVTVVAVSATLTLLPAALALLGDGLERGRGRTLMYVLGVALLVFAGLFFLMGISAVLTVTYLLLAVVSFGLGFAGIDLFHRLHRGKGADAGFWHSLTQLVMQRPVLLLATAGGLMLAAAGFYFTIELGESGISTLPPDTSARRAFGLIEERFSQISLESPNYVVIDGQLDDPQVQAGITELRESIAQDASFVPAGEEVNDAGDLTVLWLYSAHDTRSTAALDSIRRLRGEYVPAALDGSRAAALVGGDTAFSLDFREMVDEYTPIVFSFVLGISFLLLLLAFRSLVVPLKSVVMNLLSVGTAYGLLVLVFQHGFGNELFGFRQVEKIDAWVPLFMFSVLFGLSMDYHVFLLSRIRERYDQTGANVESVAHGLLVTAGMITGAALIMVAVFGGFAMGELSMFQQMGFGLAAAVILDATVVRSILVPASMRLLGDLNWYFPRWLEWLPKISVEGRPEEEQPSAPERAVVAD
jgi:RND superfamily putative drug exporter